MQNVGELDLVLRFDLSYVTSKMKRGGEMRGENELNIVIDIRSLSAMLRNSMSWCWRMPRQFIRHKGQNTLSLSCHSR